MNLVLDLDDTIIPSSVLYEEALMRTLGQYLFWQETFKEARGQVKDLLPNNHVAARNRLLYFKRFLELKNDTSQSALALYDQYEYYLTQAIKEWAISHKRFQLLCDLASKTRIFVLTNENTRTQLSKLQALTGGNLSIFSGILTSEEVGVEKPHQFIFEVLLSRFDLNVKDCLMVGDSLENDVFPARNLGMRALLTCEFIKTVDPEYPVLNTLSELQELGVL